jgi:hypothetical protein
MKRFLCLLGMVVALVVLSPAIYAGNPAQDCEDAGGIYTADGPNSHCDFPGTPVGNSGNTKGGGSVTGPGKSEPNSEPINCEGVNNKPHDCP